MVYKTVIESIRDYMQECPCFDELSQININYLDNNPNYFSIEEAQKEEKTITAYYLDGMIEKEFHFILSCMFSYSADLATNIHNSGFLDKIEEWIEDNNLNGIMPILRIGLNPISIMVTKSGYLSQVNETKDKVKYQIHLKMIYEKTTINK